MKDLATLALDGYSGLHSQMSSCEQMALQHMLSLLQPQRAVEVGTYLGGSLQILARFCKHVESIDIDPSVSTALKPLFSNVTFATGDSALLLPSALSRAEQAGEPVAFILIDGDHTTEGVKRDINSILRKTPSCEMVILMHDSFNPDCRIGISSANWQECPYVHEVELDYIPGIYHEHAYDTASERSMWGGFACALLQPIPRRHDLIISTRQQGLFEAVYRQSRHAPIKRTFLQRSKTRLRRLLPGSAQ